MDQKCLGGNGPNEQTGVTNAMMGQGSGGSFNNGHRMDAYPHGRPYHNRRYHPKDNYHGRREYAYHRTSGGPNPRNDLRAHIEKTRTDRLGDMDNSGNEERFKKRVRLNDSNPPANGTYFK